jgi:hypothetical protein
MPGGPANRRCNVTPGLNDCIAAAMQAPDHGRLPVFSLSADRGETLISRGLEYAMAGYA